jgi:two-component system phosphate regulon sensor histidine kinase PhoR
MSTPLLIVAAAALLVLHFWWRRELARLREKTRSELQSLERLRAEQTLQLQTRQQALFDSMIEGVLVLDEARRVQLANRAFETLFGVTVDLRGKTILEVMRRHEIAALLDRLAAGEPVLGYELTLDGMPGRHLQVNGAALTHGQGDVRGMVLVFHDLTRLKHLERAREEFVANVSHELRTPLSLIKGGVETLLDGAKDNPEAQTKFLRTIQRNSERLQFLIEDLLTISELESGRLRMNLAPVPLRSLVDAVLEEYQTQAAARTITLTNEVPDTVVPADGGRLQQVLGNLVDNAIKYGRAGGTVAVQARPGDDSVEVCVRDDGPGIPPEFRDRLFERFYRVDKARSRETGGTGLGLAIVKHIVQGHGGRVWVDSEPGEGSAFCFTLPRSGAKLSTTA